MEGTEGMEGMDAVEEVDVSVSDAEPTTGWGKHVYWLALAAAVLLVLGATAFYHWIESWSWVDAFYFSSVAITTVGFGDLTPSTDASKLFTVFYVFAGIALIGAVMAETLRRHTLWLHSLRGPGRAREVSDSGESNVVVALFSEPSAVERMMSEKGRVAAGVEIAAEEAVVVIKEPDGTLSVHRSDHSAPRSLAVLAAKLMIVLPLGFHGVLATMTAAAQVGAAQRSRSDRDVRPTDLGYLSDRIQPGWAAVVATYPEKYLRAAVSMYDKLGAVMVWHATESQIERVIEQQDIAERP